MKIIITLLLILFYCVSFSQKSGTAVTDAAIIKKIEGRVDTLLGYIRYHYTEGFTNKTVYRGEDKSRKWKAARDASNKEELEEGKAMMKKISAAMNDCSEEKFLSVTAEKESEGVWYVYIYQCTEGTKINLAFLKINNNFLLGDVDIEN